MQTLLFMDALCKPANADEMSTRCTATAGNLLKPPEEITCRTVSTLVVAVVVPILTLRPTLKLCHVPLQALFFKPGSELGEPGRRPFCCSGRIQSSTGRAQDFLKLEVELLGFIPATPDELG